MNKKTGKVYLIGAGPGDPGLLTVKGKEILEKADTVIYDALAGAGVLGLIPPSARQINVGKRSGRHSCPQEEINRILIEEGEKGGIVVRLKGGDPFVFGRGGEELLALRKAGIPYEVVPGVTSAAAVPAYGGIPVTHRGMASSFHVITGHKRAGAAEKERELLMNYPALAALDGTLIFLMGVTAAETICRGLLDAGMEKTTPAAFLQEGTTAAQKVLVSTLEHLAEDGRKAGIHAPAILMVGEVCRLSGTIDWRENLPLHGTRILVTRPRARSARLSALLRGMGAEVIELPAVETIRVSENAALDEIFGTPSGHLSGQLCGCLNACRWLVFTSPAGAEYFFEELKERNIDIRRLYEKKIAVIGRATGDEFRKRGIIPDYMPEWYYARELGKGLAEQILPGERVLLLRAEQGSRELTEILEQNGIFYREAPLYHTEYPPAGALTERVKELLAAGTVDYVTFTSGSTVAGFLAQLEPAEKELQQFTAVCIGTETEKAAVRAGMRTVTAAVPSIESMAACIAEQASKNSKAMFDVREQKLRDS